MLTYYPDSEEVRHPRVKVSRTRFRHTFLRSKFGMCVLKTHGHRTSSDSGSNIRLKKNVIHTLSFLHKPPPTHTHTPPHTPTHIRSTHTPTLVDKLCPKVVWADHFSDNNLPMIDLSLGRSTILPRGHSSRFPLLRHLVSSWLYIVLAE